MWGTQVQSLSWEDILEKEMDSCLEIPMGGGAWYTTPHGVTKSQTRLTNFNSIFRYSRRWVLEEPAFIYIVECSAYVFFE